jgi:hypothetical protein
MVPIHFSTIRYLSSIYRQLGAYRFTFLSFRFDSVLLGAFSIFRHRLTFSSQLESFKNFTIFLFRQSKSKQQVEVRLVRLAWARRRRAVSIAHRVSVAAKRLPPTPATTSSSSSNTTTSSTKDRSRPIAPLTTA